MITIISINLILLSGAILFITLKPDTASIEKEIRRKNIADYGDRERDRLENALYAVPENKVAFLNASINAMNNWEFPWTCDSWPRLVSVGIGADCDIYYLVPQPLPLGTYELASGGVDKYQPWADIDRYAVYCRRGNRDHERCAVCKKLRELCAVRDMDLVSVDPNALVACRDDDGLYGDAGITYVGEGDGRCGPVSMKMKLRERKVYRALEEECKACVFDREDGEEKPAASVDVRPEVAHAGIIPFLKRLIGRRKTTGGTRQ